MPFKIRHLVVLLAMVAGLLPAMSYAQNCDGLDQNASWQAGMANLIAQLDKEEYDAAIETAKPLFAICPTMPSLNYYTGLAMKHKDPQRALLYFQEAAKRTSQFSTTTAMSRKIWYELFDAEHPERTEAAVAQLTQSIIGLNNQIESQKTVIATKDDRINALEKQVIQADNTANNAVNANNAEVKQNYYRTMWTGAGLGIGGLLVTGGGLAMALLVDNKKEFGSSGYKVSTPYIIGWSLVGAGAALTVAGTIITGIAGYQYTHIDVPDTDLTLSFDVSPVSATFGLTF